MRDKLASALAMAGALAATSAVAQGLPVVRTSAENPVPQCATPARMMAYLQARNPALDPRYAGIAGHYMRIGQELGLRWDYAFFQMIMETGNLAFQRGDGQPGVVKASQNNFAGLGAAGPGETGESFVDIAAGVKAHLQHLAMYAGERIDTPVAERTRKVQDWGIIAAWHKTLRHPVGFADVTRKWAADPAYSSGVEAVGRRFYDDYCARAAPGSRVAAAAPPPRAQADRVRAERAPVELAPVGPAPDSNRVSGVDLARQAVERARVKGNDSRAGLGFAPPIEVNVIEM